MKPGAPWECIEQMAYVGYTEYHVHIHFLGRCREFLIVFGIASPYAPGFTPKGCLPNCLTKRKIIETWYTMVEKYNQTFDFTISTHLPNSYWLSGWPCESPWKKIFYPYIMKITALDRLGKNICNVVLIHGKKFLRMWMGLAFESTWKNSTQS